MWRASLFPFCSLSHPFIIPDSVNSRRARSIRDFANPFSEQNDWDSSRYDPEIEKQACLADIPEIKGCFILGEISLPPTTCAHPVSPGLTSKRAAQAFG